MSELNWSAITDGGAFESLMHALLYAEEPGTILFGRPGPDSGQDARSADGKIVYQAKYRQSLNMDGAVTLALAELETIKKYRETTHANSPHWQKANRWILVANLSLNPNDVVKWSNEVVPLFHKEGLVAEYWSIETLEGKLTQQTDIREVFFGGKNRVLVGLKEAYDLLMDSCVGSTSFAIPLVGRNDEIERIKSFAKSTDKKVMPIVGPAGTGKSRLLYESLVLMGQDGWRVLWAFPGAMSRSSEWFKLLNGNQQTCVVIDNPEDPGLLGAVIEQLVAVERRNWRVLVSCRTENAEVLRRYRKHRSVEEPLVLSPLDEPASKTLLKTLLGNSVEESWLHSAFKYTHGTPGWLCLIAEFFKTKKLTEMPTSADEIASSYVDSFLETFGDTEKNQSITLLRWLSLWGTLTLDTNSAQQLELTFLERMGVPGSCVRRLLNCLVEKGLVKNWGVGRRMYAVEPAIIREYILSSWLLEYTDDTYRVSTEGRAVVADLINNVIPKADKVLNSLSCLSCSRLDSEKRFSFLQPVFENMETLVRDETVIAQYIIIDFIEKVGAADPERALDVLILIRKTPKMAENAEHPFWGKDEISHSDVLEKIPWVLFELAEQVDSNTVARRFLEELRELIAIEVKQGPKTDYEGKSAQKLLKRLLCKSKKSSLYVQPAREAIDAALAKLEHWSLFDEILLSALLNPRREWTEWSSDWTITFVNRVLDPQGAEGIRASELRDSVFCFLRTSVKPDVWQILWHILAESHHEIQMVITHSRAKGTVSSTYEEVLRNDLTSCLAILKAPPFPLTIEEATRARELWKWYLEHGSEDDPVDLAKKCEVVYNNLSTWRMQDFFQFAKDAVLATETVRVSTILRQSLSPSKYIEFFDEVRRYLKAARQGSKDMLDGRRIEELAEACADLFEQDIQQTNALTKFVTAVLTQGDITAMEWAFAVRICQTKLLKIKRENNSTEKPPFVKSLLNLTPQKAQLLFDLYSNAHPNNIGQITEDEFELIITRNNDFETVQWAVLLGVMSVFFWEKSNCILDADFEGLRDKPIEASQCMYQFVRYMYITSLRYNATLPREAITWILKVISKYGLNGVLLEVHELTSLREKTDFRLKMRELFDLLKSRIELEKKPKPNSDFDIVPHDFKIADWCHFDLTSQVEIEAFYDICRLTIENNTFVSIYWMPKYIAQLDPSGAHVTDFLRQHLGSIPNIKPEALARLGYLISAYRNDTDAWASGARLICEKAYLMTRKQREQVYFGIDSKETNASCTAGEVPPQYYEARDNAARLLASEPNTSSLRPYWEWKLKNAEADLESEKGWIEEVNNG